MTSEARLPLTGPETQRTLGVGGIKNLSPLPRNVPSLSLLLSPPAFHETFYKTFVVLTCVSGAY